MTDLESLANAQNGPVWHEGRTHGHVAERAPASGVVDVAIVGGGLSGLWTAYYWSLIQPEARIAIFESSRVGFGASGRNGGWCSGFLPLLPTELAAKFGRDASLLAYRASFETLAEVERVVRRESIECDWHRGGTIQSASTPLQAVRLRRMVEAQWSIGVASIDIDWIEPAEVAKHLRVAGTFGAVHSPHCATVNPFALVLGLARVVRARGVRIWEESGVTGIGDGTVAHVNGVVRAPIVVQATEGFSARFRGQRRRLLPLYSLMVATEPLARDVVEALGWRNRATFNDGGRMIIYAQLTADGRIAFGGRGAPYHFGSRVCESFDRDDVVHERIARSIGRYFPAAAGARITHRWGGPLGVPRDWIPGITIDRTGGRVALGGYSGDGVAATNLFARTLVDGWFERDSPLRDLPFLNHHSPRWEYEPFRFLGVNGMIRLAESIDSYEARRGREPGIRTRIYESLV